MRRPNVERARRLQRKRERRAAKRHAAGRRQARGWRKWMLRREQDSKVAPERKTARTGRAAKAPARRGAVRRGK